MKFNRDNFKFEEVKMQLNPRIVEEYEQYIKLEKPSEYQKTFIKNFLQIKENVPVKTKATHIKTGVSITVNRLSTDNDEKIILELMKQIKQNRIKAQTPEISPTKNFDGANYNTIGGVFTTPNAILEIGKNITSNNPKAEKKPRSNKINYIGVELEFNDNGSLSDTELGKKFTDAGLARYVCVGYDGSCGFEVRVLLPDNDFVEKLTKIMNIIKKAGFTADSRCGTHVHLDMRNRDPKVAYANLFKALTFLKRFQNESRKSNTYCKPNTKATFDEQQMVSDRYHAINTQSYKKYKTIELRMHQGTLEPTQLIPWIQLLLKIVNKSEVIQPNKVMSLTSVVKHFEVEKSLVDAIKERLSS